MKVSVSKNEFTFQRKSNGYVIFLLASVVWFILFCLLITVQILNCREVRTIAIPAVEFTKFDFPFPFGWSMIMEWMFPFMLCIGYIAAWCEYSKVYSIVKGIMGAGLIEIMCGKYGLKVFQFDTSRQVLFSPNTFYWNYADKKWGPVVPVYFAIWCVTAFLLLLIAEKLKEHISNSKILHMEMGGLYLFCISQGVVTNWVYWGKYTIYFLIRNVLLLLYLIYLGRNILGQGGYDACVNGSRTKIRTKARPGIKIWLVIYLVTVCIDTVINYMDFSLMQEGKYSLWVMFIRGYLTYICRNYSFIIVLLLSVHVLNQEFLSARVEMMAVTLCTAFLVQWYMRECNIRENAIIGASAVYGLNISTWLFIFYLLAQWMWKSTRQMDILFLTMEYALAVGLVFVEKIVLEDNVIVNMFGILYIILYLTLYGITVRGKSNLVLRNHCSDWKGPAICLLIFGYEVALLYDCGKEMIDNLLKCEKSYSLLWNIGFPCVSLSGLYALPFFYVLFYLAHAMGKVKMQVFCLISTMAMSLYLNMDDTYQVGQIKCIVGVPIIYLLLIVLMLLYISIKTMLPMWQTGMGKVCVLVTYAVFFYETVVPVVQKRKFFMDSNAHYRIMPYIVTQAVLFILVIIVLILFRKGENYEQELQK